MILLYDIDEIQRLTRKHVYKTQVKLKTSIEYVFVKSAIECPFGQKLRYKSIMFELVCMGDDELILS